MPTREERQRKITECLSGFIESLFYDRAKETMEYFHRHRESILQSLLSALSAAAVTAGHLISSGKKRKVKFVQFSYLWSGVLTNERRLKIDCYDAGYYTDTAEVSEFWDYSELFPYVDQDIDAMRSIVLKQLTRVKDYELIDLRMVYHMGVFAVMEEVLTLLTADEAFSNALTEIYEPEVYVAYGAYLDQSKLLATIQADTVSDEADTAVDAGHADRGKAVDYFMVRPHPDYTDAPQLRDVDTALSANHFRFDRSYDMPMRIVNYIKPNEYTDFTDYLYQFVPLFSDEAMKVIRRFDDDFIQKDVILLDPESAKNHLYHLPFFPRFSSDVVLAPDAPGALGRSDAKPELAIPYPLPVFYVFWDSKCFLFMRLDLAESLLRNGARGFHLQKAAIYIS